MTATIPTEQGPISKLHLVKPVEHTIAQRATRGEVRHLRLVPQPERPDALLHEVDAYADAQEKLQATFDAQCTTVWGARHGLESLYAQRVTPERLARIHSDIDSLQLALLNTKGVKELKANKACKEFLRLVYLLGDVMYSSSIGHLHSHVTTEAQKEFITNKAEPQVLNENGEINMFKLPKALQPDTVKALRDDLSSYEKMVIKACCNACQNEAASFQFSPAEIESLLVIARQIANERALAQTN